MLPHCEKKGETRTTAAIASATTGNAAFLKAPPSSHAFLATLNTDEPKGMSRRLKMTFSSERTHVNALLRTGLTFPRSLSFESPAAKAFSITARLR